MRKAAVLLFALAGCGEKAPAAAKPVPQVKVVKEGDLQTVTLTAEAEAHHRIQVAPVEVRKVERTRVVGGVATAVPGARVTVTAPLAGTLSGEAPPAGRKVERGQAVFMLAPILSPDARASLAGARAQAEGDAKTAAVQLEASKLALARAELLLKEKAGPQKAVDEARARMEGAQAAHQAAEARKAILAGAETGTYGTLPAASPFEGVLLAVHASSGQIVPAGAPLFEVADLSRIWVRVPLFAGDVRSVDPAKEAVVNGLAARPVGGPPSADPVAATADLFYEVDNRKAALRAGENVSVTLLLSGETEGKVVPHGAILYDVHGGTWVYERSKPLTYVRRRVQVARVAGGWAVLKEGPPMGTEVVSAGAMELFGAEFYISK